VKRNILYELIENAMGKTDYFDIIERYLVCGYNRSERLEDDRMIVTLTRAAT